MHSQKVAIYCRLSVEDNEMESESIKNQKLLLTDYAKKQGWEIYDIYCDSDWSGLRDDRPAFVSMLQHARAHDFSIILCKTQSRFTRSIQTAERCFNNFLLWDIRFVTLVDNVDTMQKGTKKARQINSLINEWYSEEISDNIRAVFRRKMETGQFLGNYAPYGYDRDLICRHHIVVDKNTAEIVRAIFNWFLYEKMSCREIAQKLTQTKIPTPWQSKVQKGIDLGRKNVKNPSVWSENTIRRILKNRVYIGDMVQGRQTKLSFKDKKVVDVSEKNWIIVKGTHQPIISNSKFFQVQKLMQSRVKR